MRLKYLPIVLGIGGLLSLSSLMAQTFTSTNKKTTTVELFTSQGCSSCPPAEMWLNQFVDDENLWHDFVPLAFHVDYWDYLGWKDPYADDSHSQRQRDYFRVGKTTAIYTPGFVLNGKQWRWSWRYRNSIPVSQTKAGILKAKLNGNTLNANYNKGLADLTLNVAILGFGIKTTVNAGENSGEKLSQEFVVLKHIKQESTDNNWQIKLPKYKRPEVKRYALALWVNQSRDPSPLQSVGGWLQ